MTTVLYIEDEEQERELVAHMLTMLGVKVELAENGERGIDKARVISPDLILLDWRMPGMEGAEVIKFLRESTETCNIPIVVFSHWVGVTGSGSSVLKESRVYKEAMQAGAEEVLLKEFDPWTLRDIVERFAGKKIT
jgi:CheY-like chemotaxis protein